MDKDLVKICREFKAVPHHVVELFHPRYNYPTRAATLNCSVKHSSHRISEGAAIFPGPIPTYIKDPTINCPFKLSSLHSTNTLKYGRRLREHPVP